MKKLLKTFLLKSIRFLHINSESIGGPRGCIDCRDWCNVNPASGLYKKIRDKENYVFHPPLRMAESLHVLYRQELHMKQSELFVTNIRGAGVWGRYGAVITPDNYLMSDVSREFGKYGGVFGKEHSVFRQLSLGEPKFINSNVAVVACTGSGNYHHWIFDTLPRIGLLRESGFMDEIDYYIIDKMDFPFQNESLKLLNIPEEKIFNCHSHRDFHIKAKNLLVPSLVSRLGTINEYQISFLRDLFIQNNTGVSGPEKVYISRSVAPTRKLLNEEELISFLKGEGFEIYYPEEHSISYTANHFMNLGFLISVHGSGMANLAFAKEGVKVIDIVAPKHLDPYYLMITEHRKGKYGYFYGNGDVDEENTELVKNRVDEDIVINMRKFKEFYGGFR